MPTITQLQSQLNELKARKEQLSDRRYYSEQEEAYRLPTLQEKIDALDSKIKLLIDNIEVVDIDEVNPIPD